MRKSWSASVLKIVFSVFLILPLSGCFCGQFFRGTTDVVGVTIAPSNPAVLPGVTQQFTATGTFAGNGGTGDVTPRTIWTSSDTSIATINSNGLAKAIKLGAVTISGNCECYLAQTTLTVSGSAVNLTSIGVTPANATVPVGLTQQMIATATYSDGTSSVITTTAVWTSSNNAVATVSSGGLVTAVASGNATITAASGSVTGNTPLTVQ